MLNISSVYDTMVFTVQTIKTLCATNRGCMEGAI
jgi:hypothetical protein